MTDESTSHDQSEQQEIVRRYAVQLSQAAAGTRVRPTDPSIRRCYELLNECAMELAALSRRTDGDASPVN